jgi:hypothetical protein
MKVFLFWLLDELGEEFHVTIDSPNYEKALALVIEQYPESSIESWRLTNWPTPAHHTIKES